MVIPTAEEFNAAWDNATTPKATPTNQPVTKKTPTAEEFNAAWDKRTGFGIGEKKEAHPLKPAWETMKHVGEVLPAAEVAAQWITSSYGLPISGIVGGIHGIFSGSQKAAKTIERIQKYLIHEPGSINYGLPEVSKHAKELSEAANYPFTVLEHIGTAAKEKLEASGHPLAGIAASTLISGAPAFLFAKGWKARRVARREAIAKKIRQTTEWARQQGGQVTEVPIGDSVSRDPAAKAAREQASRREDVTKQGIERRKAINAIQRKRVEHMTMEERGTALLTDRLTSLKNERAYLEETGAASPIKASIDVDGLKYVNDTFGHDAGNIWLQKVGEALERAAEELGEDKVYHFHGDEFALQGKDPVILENITQRAKEILSEEPITFPDKNGDLFTLVADFSHGIADTMKKADTLMMENKKARKVERGKTTPVEDALSKDPLNKQIDESMKGETKEPVPVDKSDVPFSYGERDYNTQATDKRVTYEGIRGDKAIFKDPRTGKMFSIEKGTELTHAAVEKAYEATKKTETKAPPAESPLKDLTGKLKDVEKRREFSPARRAQEIKNAGVRRIANGFESIKEHAEFFWQKTKAPVVGSYQKIMGKYDFTGRERPAWESSKWAKEIQAIVPKSYQEAIANYIEAKGDVNLLKERAAATSDKYLKQGYNKATKLPEDMKKLADSVSEAFDVWADKLEEAGVLGDQFVEGYVNHLWQFDPKAAKRIQAEVDAGLLRTNPSFIRKRIFESYFEGEQKGYRPRNKSIGYLVVAYARAAEEALAARRAVHDLFHNKASDGEPLLVPDMLSAKQVDFKEYRVIDPNEVRVNKDGEPRALRVFDDKNKAEAFIKESGNEALSIAEKDRAAILMIDKRGVTNKKAKNGKTYKMLPNHPALRDFVWNTKDSAGNPIFYKGRALAHPEIHKNLSRALKPSAIRRYAIGRGALKGSAFAKQTMLSMSIFHAVQLSVHAAGHKVNLAHLKPIDLYNPKQARMVEAGLTLDFETGLYEFSEGLRGGGLLDYVPGVNLVNRWIGKYTFQDLLPKLKMNMALEAFERNMKRNSKLSKAKQLTADQVASITADQANSAFGGLNYRKLGRNKTAQDMFRLLALAPDFLEARARFAGQAFRPQMHREQLAAMARLAGTMWTAARIFNKLVDDDWHFEKPFSFIMGDHEFTLRSVPGDIIHLITDPQNFAYHRLNPTGMRTLVEWLTDRDKYGKDVDMEQQIKDFFITHIPIPAQGYFRKGDAELWESILSSMGLSTYKHRTPAEREMSRLISLNVPSKQQEPFMENIINAKAKLKQAVREGKVLDPEVIKELNQLSPRQARKILRDSTRFTRFQDGFQRLNLKEALQVFNKTQGLLGNYINGPKERFIASFEIQKKFQNAVKNTPYIITNLTDDEKEELKKAFAFLEKYQ